MTNPETDLEAALDSLDISLFSQIQSQSTDMDKASLLAIQAAVRGIVPDYKYLEIGSYLGGSIQPHLLDPKCRRIYSIDKRPPQQPDARGCDWRYENNSTERMLAQLSEVAGDLSKIVTIDGDTKSISRGQVSEKVDLCFIDGEHTDEAAIDDFKFCLDVLANDGAIVFHDSHIVYNGIAEVLLMLHNVGQTFNAYVLPHTVFVIEIGTFSMKANDNVARLAADNSHSYLFALRDNDHFRRFANRFPFGHLRRIVTKIRAGNVSK